MDKIAKSSENQGSGFFNASSQNPGSRFLQSARTIMTSFGQMVFDAMRSNPSPSFLKGDDETEMPSSDSLDDKKSVELSLPSLKEEGSVALKADPQMEMPDADAFVSKEPEELYPIDLRDLQTKLSKHLSESSLRGLPAEAHYKRICNKAIEEQIEEIKELKNFSLYFDFEYFSIVICKLHNQDVQIVSGGEISKFDDGGVSNIYRVTFKPGAPQKTSVLKIAQEDDSKTNNATNRKEAELLEKLHQEGIIEGLQEKPLSFIYQYDERSLGFNFYDPCGFVSRDYDAGNLYKNIERAQAERHPFSLYESASIICRIMKVNQRLMAQGYYDTDLKPENLFGKTVIDENGKTQVVYDLCDLSVQPTEGEDFQNRLKHPDKWSLICTTVYISSETLCELDDVRRAYKKAGKKEIELLQNKEKKLLESIVLSEIGVIAYHCFYTDPKEPYDCVKKGRDEFPNYKTLNIPNDRKINKEIQDCIKQMIDPKLHATTTYDNIFSQWQSYKETVKESNGRCAIRERVTPFKK
jgi:hypothetical protein